MTAVISTHIRNVAGLPHQRATLTNLMIVVMNQVNRRKLAKQLYKMTWPMLFGVLSIMSFQLIDSAFIRSSS